MSRIGHRRIERADLAHVMADNRCWTGIGIVVARDGGEHYEIEEEDGAPVDVLVEVDLMPRRESVTCRLAAVSGGPGAGLWKVPPVGAEVVVAIPEGQLEAGPIIIGVLSTRDVPGALDADKLILINPGDIIIASKNGKVYLGSEDGSGTKKVAFKDGEVDMGTWIHVPASGSGVSACSLSWVPPGGSGEGTAITTGTQLDGKISEGSDTTEVKP
jgi:uncharacterized protein involved in type VI secretion and phage assembly